MKKFLFLLLLPAFLLASPGAKAQDMYAQNDLHYPSEVRAFYYHKHTTLFWFSKDIQSGDLREQLWQLVDSARYQGAAQLNTPVHPLKIKQLSPSVDYYRWIAHFKFSRYILVNIASATLRYYEDDSLRLKMKVVAGTPSHPTPRFSAQCRQVTLYPYWNVPRKIAVTELLPLFKSAPGLMDAMGMQVINEDGNIIDYHTLPWATFTKNNFPYSIRQITGCGNALGVIKFDLTDPFDVYMHDTNLKSAFLSPSRYYSHGCIRLEKPFLLATYLLGTQLDTTLLTQCPKHQKPIRQSLENAVPVLVVYMTAEADETGSISYFKDIYHLLN